MMFFYYLCDKFAFKLSESDCEYNMNYCVHNQSKQYKDTKGIEKRDEIAQDIKMMAVKFLKKNADDDAVEVPKPAPTPTPPNPPPAAVAPNTSTAPKNNGKFDPIRISVRNVLRESLTRRLV